MSKIIKVLNCSVNYILRSMNFRNLERNDDWHLTWKGWIVLPGLGLQTSGVLQFCFTYWSLSVWSSLYIDF